MSASSDLQVACTIPEKNQGLVAPAALEGPKEPESALQSALEAWLSKWGDEDPVATETGFVKPNNKAKAKGKGKAKK